MEEDDSIYVFYYLRNFTREELEEAKRLYFQWCKKNKQVPEISEHDDIMDMTSDEEKAHVIYHAEIEGFKYKD